MRSIDSRSGGPVRVGAWPALGTVPVVALALGLAAFDTPREDPIRRAAAADPMLDGPGSVAGAWSNGGAVQSGKIVLADLDGDGDLDLAAKTGSGGHVKVLWNDGGEFASETSYGFGDSFYPWQLAPGDVDGDGDLDLVLADIGEDQVLVLVNQGGREFRPASPYSVSPDPYSPALGDLDGDGDLDLVTANSSSNHVAVLANDGSGFATPVTYGVGEAPQWVALGDVDNDGDLDAVVANSGSGDVSVLLNDGSGRFTPLATVPVGEAPRVVLLADLDSDGDLDLVTASGASESGEVSVRLNRGDGSFGSPATYEMPGAARWVAAGDMNGDGNLDLVAAVRGVADAADDEFDPWMEGDAYTGMVTALYNRGDGSFDQDPPMEVSSNLTEVVLGDVDGDGDLDVVVLSTNWEGVEGTVTVVINGGGRTFAVQGEHEVMR